MEKGLMQVNLPGDWLFTCMPSRLSAAIMKGLFFDVSLHLCVPNNSMMETSGLYFSETC